MRFLFSCLDISTFLICWNSLKLGPSLISDFWEVTEVNRKSQTSANILMGCFIEMSQKNAASGSLGLGWDLQMEGGSGIYMTHT